jgi:CheY-like chemotaxis protein
MGKQSGKLICSIHIKQFGREKMKPELGEEILVVDDNPNVCKILGLILRDHGFKVTCAANGEEAIASYHPDIRRIITDMNMPGMTGNDVARHIRSRQPKARIILCWASTGDKNKPQNNLFDAFVPKPFTIEALIAALHEAT